MNSDTGAPPATPEPATARIAATNKEKALWLVEKLVPDSGINNVGLALQVSGRLRPDALRAAMAIVLGRYEALRTVFHASGADLVKHVVPAGEFGTEIEPLRLSADGLDQDLVAFVDRPFRFDGQPLVRIGTAGHPDGDVLCVAVHHLAFDMVSVALFIQAFIPVYDALAAGRPVPPPAQAAPTHTEPAPKPADLAYWRETLAGVTPGGLDLWCGMPRRRQPAMTGENAGHALSPEAQAAVMHLQRTARAPVAAILLAAYAALLAAHGAGPDLVIGSPVDVRGTHGSAIGYHVNVVPLRVRVDFAEGFRALVRKARDTFLGAMAHAHTSVDELTGELPGFGSSRNSALFRHLFNFLPEMSVGELAVDGMTARLLTVENPYSKFDLELVGTPSKGEVLFRYSREILSRADVEALLRRFDALLVAAAQDPDRPLGETAGWSVADRESVDRANDTAGRPPYPALPEAFAAHAAADPSAAAVVSGGHTADYGQVDARAHAIRALLAGAGVRAGDVVAAAVPRAESAAAALGVWRSGAVLLPLDPDGDPAWLTRRLAHARPAAVLTGPGVRLTGTDLPPVLPLDALLAPTGDAVRDSSGSTSGAATSETGTAAPAVGPDAVPDPAGPAGREARSASPMTGEDAPAGTEASTPSAGADAFDPAGAACLMHTCGDDGQPVPVLLSHAGLADAAGHFADELGVRPGTGVLTLAGAGSLAALLDLGLALGAGARLVVAPEEARAGGPALREAVEGHDVSVVVVPPGVPARVLEDAADRPAGLTVLVQGDEIARATAERLLAAGCRLHCAHGTAATTGRALSGRAESADAVANGRPVTRTRAFVTAPDGRELPVGVRGELRLAGSAVAPGTPDDPAFADDERYGRHLRTGVLARRRADGSLDLLGRADRQVATADGPVDLGEVEAVLRDHADVAAAAALAVARPGADPEIVAFAETANSADTAAGTDGPAARLLAHAAAALAAHAVPRQVVRLDALPRTPDGRPDRDALERLAEKALDEGPAPDAGADDPLVADLVAMWRKVLNTTEATAQTNFFESGGHSLLAAVLADRIEELTGTSLELSEIFEHPTPAAIAARLRG